VQSDSTSQSPVSTPAWHSLDTTATAARFATDPVRGLAAGEAAGRLAEFGPNELQRVGVRPWYVVLANQFVDVLILILLIAAVVSLAIGHATDAVTIIAIVILNGALGFVQEWRAERSLEALRRMLAPDCKLVRDGQQQVAPTRSLVPGDLVVLETGDRVPADLRLVETLNLRTDESALTGESMPVGKDGEAQVAATPLHDRRGMAWMGSAVTHGHALGLVVATGMRTEFGRIAALTQTVGDELTPLQKKLGQLGKVLGVLSIGLSAAVAALGWALGRPLVEMFFTGVALAVAIVPEALPIVVTTTLALGVRAMVRKHALFRRLQAAETLGAATVICSDKTGTMTSNQMTVTGIRTCADEFEVTGVGYAPRGSFRSGDQAVDPRERAALMAILETGMICSHAQIEQEGADWQARGEPTEAALIAAAGKAGLASHAIHRQVGADRVPMDELPNFERVSELSFSSSRKRMTVVARSGDEFVAHTKGAPEVILERCTHVAGADGPVEVDHDTRQALEASFHDMAGGGMRVLALARRSVEERRLVDEDSLERGLCLLGFVGIIDPPRPEVAHAVQMARSAGIRVVMITGDAGPTALAVARAVGLDIERVLTGDDLAAMTDAELGRALDSDALFARTSPEHKLRIVSVLQAQGDIAAMTGDGVNDAPALKKADVGVAMGIRGTDVARSAADLILMDDNFRSIVAAVEEGRRQFDNIRKFVRYILSAHLGEVLAIFANIVLGGPLILLPVQILWMNLVTDGMTAIALGLEPGERDNMQRPPRDPAEPLPNRAGLVMIGCAGAYIATAVVGLFYYYLGDGSPEATLHAQTIAFTGIIVLEKVNVLNFRSLRHPLHVVGYFSNKWLLVAIALMLGLQVCAVYLPALQPVLHTVPLSPTDWLIMLAVAAPLLVIGELAKWRLGSRQAASGA